MTRHVLVPVDGSDQSIAALEYAVREYPDERITALHVVDPGTVPRHGDEALYDREELLQEIERREATESGITERARRIASDHDVEIETALERGRPAKTILEAAETGDIDHIVIGSHGRSGPSRILFGSVAETVTRRSPVPVTIVR